MNWMLVFTAQAKKDAKKLASSELKAQAQHLLDILAMKPLSDAVTLRKACR